MKEQNYYKSLSLSSTANYEQIRAQYKILAMQWHPDKFANKSEKEQKIAAERFKEINRAHETLCDSEKRAIYNEKLKLLNIRIDEDEIIDPTLLRIKSNKKPFSHKFKVFHADYVIKYQQNKLEKEDVSLVLQYFYYELYKEEVTDNYFPNIFVFIESKKNYPYIPFEFKSKLTPKTAFALFLEFLKGNFYGKSLCELISVFDKTIQSIQHVDEINLYEGIKDVLVLSINYPISLNGILIGALNKITTYAQKYAIQAGTMDFMAPLLKSKYFRHLFSLAIHCYWLAEVNAIEDEYLTMFNGEELARKLFEEYKEKLLNSDEKSLHIIKFIRTLHKFESTVHKFKPMSNQNLAEFYRDKAYHILDWSRALAGIVKPNIMANTFLQAGIFFQKASKQLQKPELQMADEAVALQCYLMAHELAQHTTPDVALYVHMQTLKYILHFSYMHDDLIKIIHAIQNKTLLIANIFPFFQTAQSNVAFFIQEDQMLILMRQLLHALMNMLEYNEKSSQKLELDHEYVTVLYQAYEACLKNWYNEKYNIEEEKKFRIKLMLELLNLNRWTFKHIKENLTKPIDLNSNIALPWITVKRDEQGWIRRDRYLALPSDEKIKFYRGLKGVEINRRTGEINFVFEPASTSNHSYTEQLISLFDVHEILVNKATAAAFSLDPPDPNRPYHPFNKMWFAPSKLYGSQLLHTMFLADYLLKFLTVGWEVQSKDPFDIKSTEELIQKLPSHLKKIITDFKAAKKNRGDDAVHRFWIQAEEMSYEENDEEEQQETDIRKIAFDTVRMIVCKHRMVRDHNGKLMDKEEKGEGWNMYVLKPHELKQNIDKLESPAMVWVDKNTVLFFEEGQISAPYVIKNYGQHLAKLFHIKRDEHNKIIASDINAIETIYRIIKEVAKQTGVDHNFSPEYIFSREFTLHYDEFAMHFPELARLRELSRIVMIVRVLESQRLRNIHIVKLMQNRIDEQDVVFWGEILSQITEEVSNNVNQEFSSWRPHFSSESIRKDKIERINHCKRQINSQIRKITGKQKNDILEQLRELFKEAFNDTSYRSVTYILEKFLDGESTPLLEALIDHDIRMVKQKISKVYPENSVNDLWEALNGSQSALKRVIDTQAYHEKEKKKEGIKQQLRTVIDKCTRVNNTLQTLGLGNFSCDIVFMSSPPKKETLKLLPIRSSAAYVCSENALHYVDVAYNQCIEISLDDEKKREFYAKFNLNQNNAITLTEEELEEITLLTGHRHDELDLTPICLWVPASVHHEVEKGYSYMVYGGVQIAGNLNQLNSNQGLLSQQVFNQENAKISAAQQLAQNKKTGDAFRDRIASFYRDMGYDVRTEVYHNTPFGGRRVDIEVSKNDQVLKHVETKTGNANRDALQKLKDEWIHRNSEIKIPTIVITNKW